MELDDEFPASHSGTYTFSVNIPMGSSRRVALESVYHRWVCFQKDMYLESFRQHADTLKAVIAKRAFVEACDNYQHDDTNDVVSVLGLDGPLRAGRNYKLYVNRVQHLYTEIVGNIQKKHDVRLDKQKQQQQKQLSDAKKLGSGSTKTAARSCRRHHRQEARWCWW